jgi:SOS-response transcriptional repressor LexA
MSRLQVAGDAQEPPDLTPVLTWRQRKILQVIRDSVRNRGYPPSTREIAGAVGLTSDSSVSYQLSRLQRMGYLQGDGHVWLISRNPVFTPVPGADATILGKVVAVIRRVGYPAEASQ